MSLEDLMGQIAEEGPEQSEPGAFYSKDGDCVFCHLEDVPYYAQRVDAILTLYRAEDDRRVVGTQIKGVSQLPPHDVLGLQFAEGADGKIELVELLLLTFEQQEPSLLSLGDSGVRRVKADYMDALLGLRGVTIPAAELQLA